MGRRQELTALKRLLGTARLVTIIGPGGVGKTRLAVHAATELRRRFSGGAWLIELAEVSHPAHVAQVIAAGLGMRDQSDRDPVDVLAEYLRQRRLLLVLDNCEHLATAVSELLYPLLRRAPDLQVIATSRQALGVTGEHLFPLDPLAVPPAEPAPSLGELLGFESVQLFQERSRAVAPAFAVTEDNRRVVAQLCARLEGLPLAIELAAARMRSLTVAQIAARLDDMAGLLAGGNEGGQPRQRALSALMGWSFELCTPAERLAWIRTSVFAGTFDLEAATAVCGLPNPDDAGVLDALAGLVDKSILTRVGDSAPRYRFLEPIRQFGRARLAESGDEHATRERHCAYFRDLVGRADAECFGPAQLDWLVRLQQVNADVRAALEFSLQNDGVDAAAIAGALRVYWHSSGSLSEGRRWLGTVLRVYAEPDRRRGLALWTDGWLALMQGRVEAALPALREGRELAESRADADLRDDMALAFGVAEMHTGDLVAARDTLSAAYRGFRARGDHVGTAIALVQLALLECVGGDADAAAAHGAECVRLSERHGESWYRAHGHWVLAVAWWRSGRAEEAIEELRASIHLMRQFGERLVMARSFEVLGWIAADQGDPDRAVRLLGMADRLWSDTHATLSAFGRLSTFHDRCIADLERRMGAEALQRGMTAAAGIPLDAAIAYALGEPEPRARPAVEGHRTSASSELTRREWEVAGLLADGKANRQIAAQLVISLRTVEAHVEHILNKLGFRSRAQVASWYVAQVDQRERDGAVAVVRVRRV
ncbi:ATP-binding protein [Pseudonocardia zijingensis]|uniref:ATP-binding protein n=1 Tax=Pseudonocardia zijingensis TaxID=153376 RepID=UPI0031D87B82